MADVLYRGSSMRTSVPPAPGPDAGAYVASADSEGYTQSGAGTAATSSCEP